MELMGSGRTKHIKNIITLVSGGVERATGHKDLFKHSVGHARSHRNDVWNPLGTPVKKFFLHSANTPATVL